MLCLSSSGRLEPVERRVSVALLMQLHFALLLYVFASANFHLRRGLNSSAKSIQKGGPLSTVFQLVGISSVLLPDTYHFNLKPLDTVQHTIKSVTK